MEVGDRIRLVAEARSLNLKELSEATGITYRSIQNYVQRKQLPGAEALAKLRECLGVDLNWLLSGEGDMFNESQLPRTGYVSCDIDPDIQEEVITELRRDKGLDIYFGPKNGIASVPAIGAFTSVYNQVCHIQDPATRRLSIRKAIGMYLIGLAKNMHDAIQNDPNDEGRSAIQDSQKNFAERVAKERGIDSGTVQQVFHKEVGQVGGGDIHNYGKKPE